MSNKKFTLFLYSFILLLLLFSIPANAEELTATENISPPSYRFESILQIDNTKTQNYFLTNGQNNFSINFKQNTSTEVLTLTLRELNFNDIPFGKTVDEKGNINNLERMSLAYEYIFSDSKNLENLFQPLAIDFKTDPTFDEFNNTIMLRKIMHYWDAENNVWKPLTSVGDVDHNITRAKTLMPHAIVALFFAKKEFESYASWYGDSLTPSSKFNGASNNYKIGSFVKVCRLDNLAKCVKLKIVSTGPYVDNRIVDLTKTAFKTIGNPGGGIVGVRVIPVK